jgi:hypothetical protein
MEKLGENPQFWIQQGNGFKNEKLTGVGVNLADTGLNSSQRSQIF